VITTTRKFFTILMSVLLFGHVLKWHQHLGILSVFGALGWEIYMRFHSRPNKAHKTH
jgi:drug/metabolite transporter (DMT)-like permease